MTDSPAPTRVLLIDDDPSLIRMTRLALVSEGLEVTTAMDGRKGLEQLDGHDFDVIVLDLQMPVMDGKTFYHELRRQRYHTPVIILSAFGAEAARNELDAEGAMTKPFDPNALIGAVRELATSNAH